MVSATKSNRYWIKRDATIVYLAVAVLIVGPFCFLIGGLFFSYKPPHGWWEVAILGPPLWIAYIWLLNRIDPWKQFVAIENGSLVVSTTRTRSIPFSELQNAVAVQHERPQDLSASYGRPARWLLHGDTASFARRVFIPNWKKPANVLLEFRRPVTMGFFPFPRYRQLLLTLSDPEEFVQHLTAAMNEAPSSPT